MSDYSPPIKKPAICGIAGGWSMRQVLSIPAYSLRRATFPRDNTDDKRDNGDS